MTDLTIAAVGDAWVNSARAGQNYGSAKWVQVRAAARIAFVRPHLGNIAGRTVVDAYLTGRSGGTVAQTLTIAPVTERWAPGQVTWSNQPAVNTAAAVSVAIPALADGATFELTGLAALVQAVADGTDYYGFRITSDATSSQSFYSSDSGEPAWEFHVELSDAPEQPSGLRPNAGAVPTRTPVLAWDPVDDQAASRVQLDAPPDLSDPIFGPVDYDSGWVSNTDPQWSLVGRHTLPTSIPSHWRVQVRDANGNESAWSDWAEITYAAAPSIVIDSPTGPFGDPTPTIMAHLSSGTVTAWQAKITGADRSDVRARQPLTTSPTIEWTVPEREGGPVPERGGRRVIDGFRWLHLRVWDDVDRAVGVGQPPYIETWVALTIDNNLGVQAPAGLTVAPVAADDPRRVWSWTRTEAADAWVVTIDGAVVARLAPEDVTVDAGRYSWTDSGHVAPLRPQALAVHAVEGDLRSLPVTLDVEPPVLPGVWLVPEADVDPIVLAGTAVDEWTRSEFRATYTTSTGRQVDVTYGQPGRVGSFEGSIDSRQDVWATLRNVETLRTSRERLARLVWGSHSIPVRLRDIDATASSEIRANNLEHIVRFGFVELDA